MSSVQYLNYLSRPLYIELQGGLLVPQLGSFPFFERCRCINPTVMREFCYTVVSVQSFANTDTIFVEGAEAKDMHFIHGDETSVVTYHYSPMENSRDVDVKLKGGSWAAEGALWMPWRHMGNLIASTEVEIFLLNANKFKTVTCVHSDLHFIARELAFSFWQELIGSGDSATDLPVHLSAKTALARPTTHGYA